MMAFSKVRHFDVHSLMYDSSNVWETIIQVSILVECAS